MPREWSSTEQVRHAFALLGLDPAADRGLIELAYAYQVSISGDTRFGGPDQQSRLDSISDAMQVLGWGVGARAGADAPRLPRGLAPYHTLRVDPAADQDLITLAYRYLLRRAAAADDADTLEALECAYARIGAPDARAAYDRGAARLGRLRLPAPPGPEPPDPPPAPARREPDGTARTARRPRLPVPRPRAWTARIRRGSASLARTALARLPHRDAPAPDTSAGTSTATAAAAPAAPPAAGHGAWRPGRPVVAQPVGGLRVEDGEREVVSLVLTRQATYTIGSGPHCRVRLPAPSAGAAPVADEHARLTVGHGWVLFQHLAPHTVSRVNGERSEWALLEPGDRVDIGPYRCHYYVAWFDGQPAASPRDSGRA